MDNNAFIKSCFESYDENFTWYIPDEDEKKSIKEELIKETEKNPHLHINKYQVEEIVPLVKHKVRNDIMFSLPGGECVIAHLVYENLNADDLHFVFFSNCQSALKYIHKQYRIEFLGENEFVLSSKDKTEIVLFSLQFLLSFMLPQNLRGIVVVGFGIILYAMILYDWKMAMHAVTETVSI